MLHKEGNIRKCYIRKVRVTPEKVVRFLRKTAGGLQDTAQHTVYHTLQKHSFYVAITMILRGKTMLLRCNNYDIAS